MSPRLPDGEPAPADGALPARALAGAGDAAVRASTSTCRSARAAAATATSTRTCPGEGVRPPGLRRRRAGGVGARAGGPGGGAAGRLDGVRRRRDADAPPRPRSSCGCSTAFRARRAPRSPSRPTPTPSTPPSLRALRAAGCPPGSPSACRASSAAGAGDARPQRYAGRRGRGGAALRARAGFAHVFQRLLYPPASRPGRARRGLGDHAGRRGPRRASTTSAPIRSRSSRAPACTRRCAAAPSGEPDAEAADAPLPPRRRGAGPRSGSSWYEICNWAAGGRRPLRAQRRRPAFPRLVGAGAGGALARRRRAVVERAAPGAPRRARALRAASPAAGRERLTADQRAPGARPARDPAARRAARPAPSDQEEAAGGACRGRAAGTARRSRAASRSSRSRAGSRRTGSRWGRAPASPRRRRRARP